MVPRALIPSPANAFWLSGPSCRSWPGIALKSEAGTGACFTCPTMPRGSARGQAPTGDRLTGDSTSMRIFAAPVPTLLPQISMSRAKRLDAAEDDRTPGGQEVRLAASLRSSEDRRVAARDLLCLLADTGGGRDTSWAVQMTGRNQIEQSWQEHLQPRGA